jgi:hypothetical protein
MRCVGSYHLLITITILLGATTTRAASFKVRCEQDMLNSPQAAGRNAWARKCGVIDAGDEAHNNMKGQYATFANFNAPTDPGAPCPPAEFVMEYLGDCNVAGCYTPDQRVMFSGVYIPIVEAARRNVATLTTPNDSWTFADGVMSVTEEPIGSYVVGDEFRDVIAIETQNGKRITVTDKHPMVNDGGEIIPATAVAPGHTVLMTVDGPSTVVGVRQLPYRGQVWNVEPVTTRTMGNILFAEGFVTGSVRYQNEWAEDATRLSLRERLDASAF